MKIYSISDVGSFLDLVKESQGNVTLCLPDGEQVDLKESHTAQKLFQIIHPGQYGLDIRLSNSADTLRFIQYMMEAGVSR